MSSTAPPRQLHIDLLKLIAAQLIVLHHFAVYGPLAKALRQTDPELSDWFFSYARMAVQVFLVLGGYLAGRSLAPGGALLASSPWPLIWQRYQRLILPLLAALLLTVTSATLARNWLSEDFIPEAPITAQLLAHATLLQDVLGYDALSAGVWYVAIDFQLFALLTLLLWLGRSPHWGRAPLLGLMLASLFYFNRDADWDNWALYFFGSYGLGVAAFWAAHSRHPGWRLTLLAGVGLLALAIDFRERIALALVVALLLGVLQWRHRTLPVRAPWPALPTRVVGLLGQTSYALFLVHFSVLMLGNALFEVLELSGSEAAMLMLLACWVTCLGLSVLFERGVEAPLGRLACRFNQGWRQAPARPPLQGGLKVK